MKTPAQIGKEMMLLGTYEDYDFDTILEVLKAADDLYYNDQQSFIEDNEYDALRRYAERLQPHHSYFTGVGSEVRGGKVKLPYQMGSLDQVEVGEIQDWVRKWNLKESPVVVTDKLDGTSAMLIYDSAGELNIAYSRGDGVMGADITRHLKHFAPQSSGLPNIVVRGEVILQRRDFSALRNKVKSRSGRPYKNARNMVAGLMNAKKNDPIVYDHLFFVAYDIVNKPDWAKTRTLQVLEDEGFAIPHFDTMHACDMDDETLGDHLKDRRKRGDFEIDGIVIDVESHLLRSKMFKKSDSLNPAYAVKYKVADASNLTTSKVKKVHWNISKHGYLKPRVEIDPVELVGVTVTYATGFNAKFIYDNGIGPGATVEITRSGDVIPFIQRVMKGAPKTQMPTDIDWEWNETGVDAVAIDADNHEEVVIKQTLDFFSTLDAPMLKEGAVRTMFKTNNFNDVVHAITSMIHYNEDHWVSCIGSNGKKIYNGLHEKLTDIPLYKLMGAWPLFGRGIGVRKMKKLHQAFGTSGMFKMTALDIEKVEGFDEVSAQKIGYGLNMFWSFLKSIDDVVTLADDKDTTGGAMEGQKVVFTGFRDKTLESLVEDEGGTMQSSISGKTTIVVALNPNSSSGKLKKAREKGIRVMGKDEFEGLLK